MLLPEKLEPESLVLTWGLHPPPDHQVDLAVPGRPVHQVDDVSVGLPHHRDPVHEEQLVSGPQASVQVCRALLDDGADQDLLAHTGCYEPESGLGGSGGCECRMH